jgi:Xaa-Pro aminopeptidase
MQVVKSIYKKRREELLKKIDNKKIDNGFVLFFAYFENDKERFRQESSFYYFTGLEEPGAIFFMDLHGNEVLYLPNYGGKREKWISDVAKPESGLEVRLLGDPLKNYFLKPFFRDNEYKNFLDDIKSKINGTRINCATIFTLLDESSEKYFTPIYRFKKVKACLSISEEKIVDISDIVARMRRKKDSCEISLLKKAVKITNEAQDVAKEKIKPGVYEYEIRAEIERVFVKNRASVAFPSIVASGKNSTVLHYNSLDKKIKEGDLIVVDVGAEYQYYCADITRTFPVSQKFSARQKEVYKVVFELQKYISSIAKPGMYLQNEKKQDYSLHHIAKKFLEKIGYEQYFVHGIGHFLGLDVHDVGSGSEPLSVGDVFTIEPGIYIPDENIGVRIEDDFLITGDRCEKLC